MVKVDLNIEHFKRILTLYPHRVKDLKDKFHRFNSWMDGSDKPTLIQLGQVAHLLNIPFGYFFLAELPEQIFPIPHYRNERAEQFEPSEELKDTVKTLQIRQEWVKDILLDYGWTPLPYVGSVNTSIDVKETVESIKKHLQIESFNAKDYSSWDDSYYHFLIEQVEKAGIFVVINGIVGNNTHRKLNVDEFRGFVLNDEIAPFVFINNNDAKSAQIFTLAHEIAHVWLGKSASFELRNMQAADNAIEIYCNQVAAEFLVPEDELNKIYKKEQDYNKIANHFKVSQIVIARRLLDLNLITKDEFFDFYNSQLNKGKSKNKDSGGDYYNNIPYRLSRRFGEIIYNAALTGKISFREAFKLTDMKPGTFDKYFKEHQK